MMIASQGLWATCAVGVLASGVAAGVYLLIMSTLRPRLHFSDHISRSQGEGGELSYRFKIVNKSRRAAVQVRLQLFVVERRQAPNGEVSHLTPLPIAVSDGVVMLLPGYRKNDSEQRYARRVRIVPDLAREWSDDRSYLIIRCYATDSWSNFGRQFEQKFHTHAAAVRDGVFEVGRSMEIQ